MSFSSFPVSDQRAPKAPIEIINGKKFQICPLCTKLGLKTRLSSRSSYVRHYRRKHLPTDNSPSAPAYKFVFYEHSTDADSGDSESNNNGSGNDDDAEGEEDDGSVSPASVADSGCVNGSTDDDDDNDDDENDDDGDSKNGDGSHNEESSESPGYTGYGFGSTEFFYPGYQYGFSGGW
ncbi:hypothetical protein H4R34_002664 [Dimargaris verticillata]|uniref:Uncharacterized protein n=1 Tax=Dimargaris verticillata TaxID=2761393 RepID=A0A9W8B637_9FUNG|nr:hypothetical protein H4R34_002664 [Dimargaris verticillata]